MPMLINRLYEPTETDVLYHYCSVSTLQAILSSGRIRFTDINMLNDSEEVRWGYSAFEEAATRLVNRTGIPDAVPKIEVAFLDDMDRYIAPVQLVAHPFVACFSTKPDSLGQWRAYGDDGRGFAVGFNAAAIRRLPATLLRVEYDRERQVEEMMRAIVAAYLHRAEGGSEDEFMSDCILLATSMVAFKHEAFAEEGEVRSVHVVHVDAREDRLAFVDPGGVSGGADVAGEPVRFTIRDNHLTAYLDLPVTSPTRPDLIREIVLGPKNFSQWGNVQLFLGSCRLPRIELNPSRVPYR